MDDYKHFVSSFTTIEDKRIKEIVETEINQDKFWNPGDVFGNADLLLGPGEKEVRNPQIVSAFRRLGLCEQAGTGIRMARQRWMYWIDF